MPTPATYTNMRNIQEQPEPTRATYILCRSDLHLLEEQPITSTGATYTYRSNLHLHEQPTGEETYRRNLQEKLTGETYRRNLQEKPTRAAYSYRSNLQE